MLKRNGLIKSLWSQPLPVCLTMISWLHSAKNSNESLALASMARDDSPASSMAAAMRGKVGSEFET